MLFLLASLWVWGLVISLLILGIYIISTWNFDHFSKTNVPYIKPVPFFGNMAPVVFRKMSFPDFALDLYNKLKGHKYGGIYEFINPTVMLRDPELIKMVFIKDFEHFVDRRTFFSEESEPLFGKIIANLQGQRWKHMRCALSPAFTSSKMKNMFILVSECGLQLQDFLHQCVNDGTMKIDTCKIEKDGNKLEIEMKDLFTRYTNDVIATSAFGIGCDSLKHPKNEFYTLGKKMSDFSGIQQLKFLLFQFSPRLMKMLKIKFIPEKLANFFRSLILDAMKTRESKNIIRPDMIHLLMQAKKGTLRNEENDIENDTSFKLKIEDDDIVAQAILFFIAGFETVSTLLCFVSHQLAVHPDIQSRLQEEIDQNLKENEGKITYEALHSMKYLDMVVSETLRIYPPAVFTDRKCVKAYTFPSESPYTIQPGEGVWVSIHGLHRDPEYFPDPDKFDPERFSDENKDKIVPFTYLPFGSGPRNCIGNRLALMQAKLALVHMLSHFDFKVVSRTPIPIQITKKGINMVVDGGFWLGIEERSKYKENY